MQTYGYPSTTYYVELCFEALPKGLISTGRVAEMMLVDNFELVKT